MALNGFSVTVVNWSFLIDKSHINITYEHQINLKILNDKINQNKGLIDIQNLQDGSKIWLDSIL